MNSTASSRGFLMSFGLHLLIVLLMLVAAYLARRQPPPAKAFEVVAGEGDNYAATVAPKLGVPGGIKLDVPAPPTPAPTPPQPEPPRVEPTPPPPAPKPTPTPPQSKTESAKPETVAPPNNFAKRMLTAVYNGKRKAEKEIKKERDAEQKRAAEEAKKQRLTKEQFDKQNKSSSSPSTSKSSTPKVARLDPEGIAKGVRDGSTENKVGGGGGKVLRAEHDSVLDAYFAMFKQRVRDNFEPPPGLSDTLTAEFSFVSAPDGSIRGVRVIKSSGSAEFDRSVLEAIRRVRMPKRPDSNTETVEFTFGMRDRDED